MRDWELVLYKYVNVVYWDAAPFQGKTRSSHSRGSRFFIGAPNTDNFSPISVRGTEQTILIF